MEDMKGKKRVRDDLEDSPEVKRLRENLLDSLDDDSEFCTTTQDLDSFIKSFEEEITSSPAAADLKSDSGESQLELGYLLEASDDELGLPPTTTSSPDGRIELIRAESYASELGTECWGFDGEIPNYDSFEFGILETENYYNGEYEALDGLFDHSDMGFGSNDFAWRSETLPTQ